MHSLSLSDYVTCLERNDWPAVAELMLTSAKKLAYAGADFLICPDNTIHQAMPHLTAESPLPWLHIADVVADEAARRGFGKVGITGTHWLIDSDIYDDKLHSRGISYEKPSEAQKLAISQIIMDQLVAGDWTNEAVRYFQQVIGQLQQRGCDAVVLGCTEIPLIINDSNSPLPTLDSSRLLAQAALRQALR